VSSRWLNFAFGIRTASRGAREKASAR